LRKQTPRLLPALWPFVSTNLSFHQIGSWVSYVRDPGEPRKGRIKFWNPRYIFVVYDCAGQWDRFLDFVAVATDPADLDFVLVTV
jgi:hypothetical protein